MGQKIYYVLAKNNTDVPLEIVHFKEKGGLVFPLLMDEYLFKDITADSENKSISNIEDFYFNVLRYYSFEYPTTKVFRFVKQNIKSFALIGYREVLDIPENFGNIVFFSNESKVDTRGLSESEVHEALNVEISFRDIIRNEGKYWNFNTAKNHYFKEMEKKVTNTSNRCTTANSGKTTFI